MIEVCTWVFIATITVTAFRAIFTNSLFVREVSVVTYTLSFRDKSEKSGSRVRATRCDYVLKTIMSGWTSATIANRVETRVLRVTNKTCTWFRCTVILRRTLADLRERLRIIRVLVGRLFCAYGPLLVVVTAYAYHAIVANLTC